LNCAKVEQLQETKSMYMNQSELIQQSRAKVQEFQKGLDKMNAVVLQVESNYEGLKSQLAVSKREVLKAEEDSTSLEKGKLEQVSECYFCFN
jgi:hypothetical protein